MVNHRLQCMKDLPAVRLSKFDILTSILWKVSIQIERHRNDASIDLLQVIIRARSSEGQESTLIFPVSIRDRLNPPLGPQYYGNACMFATTMKSMNNLRLPIDVSSLADTALNVRLAINAMTDRKVRSGIAIIEESPDVRTLNHPSIDFDNDVFFSK